MSEERKSIVNEADIKLEEKPPVKPAKDAQNGTPQEYGGRDGPDPTRFGDWENKGKCVDF